MVVSCSSGLTGGFVMVGFVLVGLSLARISGLACGCEAVDRLHRGQAWGIRRGGDAKKCPECPPFSTKPPRSGTPGWLLTGGTAVIRPFATSRVPEAHPERPSCRVCLHRVGQRCMLDLQIRLAGSYGGAVDRQYSCGER